MRRASVIIPVHGRARLTAFCLELLLDQATDVETEIVVVDDASPDETPVLLDRLVAGGAPLTVVTHTTNTGFAGACNDGAAAATGDLLVFLNNDTEPRAGWLDALVRHADAHPEAAAVGAKLLYPDGTIQHAGVVVGQDRNPHHVYAGFPADHPAVNRSRRFQIVTAACMLVRRGVFEELGGFDAAYRNGHEDVDLCLRLGRAGHEVHYCHTAEVIHLESASRGKRSDEATTNGRRYRDQWSAIVEPDDVAVYLEDGLLDVRYGDTYPVRLHVSPLLATVHDGERNEANERLLRERSHQVAGLLEHLVAATTGDRPTLAPVPDPDTDDELADALARLDAVLAPRTGRAPSMASSAGRAYRRQVARIRERIVAVTPPGATIAVISRGDDELLDLDGRTAWHFPRDDDGRWAGHHPANSGEAIAALGRAVRRGLTHLVVPATSRWWLDHYRGFAELLRSQHDALVDDEDCVVFELVRSTSEVPS